MKELYLYFLKLFRESEAADFLVKPMAFVLGLIVLALAAWVAFFLTKTILLSIVHRVAKRTKTEWDDILVKHKVFSGLAHLVPAFIIYSSCNFASPSLHQPLSELSSAVLEALSKDHYFTMGALLLKLSKIYFAIIFVYVSSTFLNACNEIYNSSDIAHHRPIKGYIQLVKIVIYFVMAIIAIAILLGKDPTVLFAGLGAMAAVLILVFKDTILGLVASVQLSANKMVKIGDRIEMPNRNIDGNVLDITLNTVKIQNADNTIATVPTYALVTETFSNWEGVEMSGGRRIKRSILIDLTTIRFCDDQTLENLYRFSSVKKLIESELKAIENLKTSTLDEHGDLISRWSLTNIGIFRKYLELYLSNHEKINTEMSFLVRQLQPTDKGLPIEIYAFSLDKQWTNYEHIQAEILDHIMAIVPEFGLRLYQSPSGEDIKFGIRSR